MADVRCPVCGAALAAARPAWRCPAGHSFDVARQGYVNLLPVQQKHSRQPGDSPAQVRARRAFLAEGHYAPLAARVAEDLVNHNSTVPTKSVACIIRDNVCTLFNLFNVCIAIALALVGAWSNMLFILIIALNTWIGVVQELHAKKLVEELSLLSAPTAKVIRDGKVLEIPAQELVEEDVVIWEAGKQVCADSVILAGEAEVNESLLTGESDPVPNSAGGRLLSGSFIVSGKCWACVEHVGAENYAAKIAREAKKLRGIHSELLSSMQKVPRFTGFLSPPLGILLFLEVFLAERGAAWLIRIMDQRKRSFAGKSNPQAAAKGSG